MGIFRKIAYILFGITLSLVILLTAVDIVTFNPNHYLKEYKKHDVITSTGMDMENLKLVTGELLSYLKDNRDDLSIKAIINGEKREVFGEREKLHMVDVKELFIIGRWIRNIGLFAIISMIVFFIRKDKRWKGRISTTFLNMSFVNLGLIVTLFLMMHLDFRKYFDYFHYIFFDNDLWLLDPNTDIMIQMLPQDFFYNTAVKIATNYIIAITLLAFLGWGGKSRFGPLNKT